MDELTQRERQAIESILDNEALTANLDDAAAQVLLDWGTAYARQAAQHTTGLDDADAVLEEKLQATQRLMRAVNHRFDPATLAQFETDPQAQAQADHRLLRQVFEQTSIILGDQLVAPTDEQLLEFEQGELAQASTPPTMIATLRRFVEQYTAPAPPPAIVQESPAQEPAATEQMATPASAAVDEAGTQGLPPPLHGESWLTSLVGRFRIALARLKSKQNQ